MAEKINLCKTCKWSKDKWHDACYCVYYGFIVSRGKDKCWGHETKEKKEEKQGE